MTVFQSTRKPSIPNKECSICKTNIIHLSMSSSLITRWINLTPYPTQSGWLSPSPISLCRTSHDFRSNSTPGIVAISLPGFRRNPKRSTGFCQIPMRFLYNSIVLGSNYNSDQFLHQQRKYGEPLEYYHNHQDMASSAMVWNIPLNHYHPALTCLRRMRIESGSFLFLL